MNDWLEKWAITQDIKYSMQSSPTSTLYVFPTECDVVSFDKSRLSPKLRDYPVQKLELCRDEFDLLTGERCV